MSNFNFNKVILGGRITADPELKSTPGGVYVTTFTVGWFDVRRGLLRRKKKYYDDETWHTDHDTG